MSQKNKFKEENLLKDKKKARLCHLAELYDIEVFFSLIDTKDLFIFILFFVGYESFFFLRKQITI